MKIKNTLFGFFFIVLFASTSVNADVTTILAKKAAESYVEKIIHDPEKQSKFLEMVKKDSVLKEKVVTRLKAFISNPKFSAYRSKAIDFLSEIDKK